MSAGGYDTPHISASFSRYDSRRSSGNIHSSYDVSFLFTRLCLFTFLTFIFGFLFRGLLYRAAGPLHPDRRVDLMIVTFQICPCGTVSLSSIGQIIIDLVPLTGLVARQALIIMNLQHAFQTQITGSALLHGGASPPRRSS